MTMELAESSVLMGKFEPLPEFQSLQDMFQTLLSPDGAGDENFLNSEAIYFDGRRVTFRELNVRSNKLARQLVDKLKLHVDIGKTNKQDKIVLVNMVPSDELIVALFAIQKINAAYLPVDPTFPASRISYFINDAKPLCILADKIYDSLQKAEMDNTRKTPIFLYSDMMKKAEMLSGEMLNSSERLPHLFYTPLLLCVLYTSGSTGMPKGVRLPHKTVMNRLCWQWKTFPFHDGEVGCFKTALTFVDHLQEIFGTLLQGIPITVVPKMITQNPQSFVNLLAVRNVTRLVLVPSLLQMFLAYFKLTPTKKFLPKLRFWVCSGETLSSELLQDFFENFGEDATICNYYGSTEIMGDVTYEVYSFSTFGEKLYDAKVPIGRPIFNTCVYLLDENLKPVPLGEIGEMFVAGLNIAAGYIGMLEENRERFINNEFCSMEGYNLLFRTGDYARIVDGRIVFEGRKDEQVKVRGHRVDLAEIENCVKMHSGIPQ